MAHWTDDLDGDLAGNDADNLVRPYTITRGRTSPDDDALTLITQITTVGEEPAPGAVRGGPDDRRRGLQPEHRAILGRCRRSAAVAEIAADLDLPVSVTKILIGDLIAAGRVRARAPLAVADAAGAGAPDLRLLQAVRDGLRKL